MVTLRKPRPVKAGRVSFWHADYGSLIHEPEFHALLEAHTAELFPAEMGRPVALDHGRYSRLSAAGMLKCYAARCDERLIGYASYLVMPTLHHGPDWVVAINDAVYLTPEHRKGWTAFRFLKQTEAALKKLGVNVIYHHDPHRQSIGQLFRALGYAPTQTTFEKVLATPQRYEPRSHTPTTESA